MNVHLVPKTSINRSHFNSFYLNCPISSMLYPQTTGGAKGDLKMYSISFLLMCQVLSESDGGSVWSCTTLISAPSFCPELLCPEIRRYYVNGRPTYEQIKGPRFWAHKCERIGESDVVERLFFLTSEEH